MTNDGDAGEATLRRATAEMFEPLLGSSLEVFTAAGDQTVHLTVEAVSMLGAPSSDPTVHRRPFSVTFRAGADDRLDQRTYRVRHADLGEFPLFLVPLQPDDRGTLYEAVFG